MSTGKYCVGDSWWGNRGQASDPENRITVCCVVPWCNVSHCLIWHSAATQLFGFVTFYGPSAPVPPIVPEFSIFGKKLDSQMVCRSRFLKVRDELSVLPTAFFFFFFFCSCSFVQKTILEKMIQLGRTTKHFSPGHLSVMLSCCPEHVIDTLHCQECKLSSL